MRDLIHGQCWVLSVFTYSHRSFLAVLRLVSGLRIPEEKNSLYVEGTKWKISIREADVFSRGGASCIDHPIACGVRDWPPYVSLYRSLTQTPPSAWSSRTRAAEGPILKSCSCLGTCGKRRVHITCQDSFAANRSNTAATRP